MVDIVQVLNMFHQSMNRSQRAKGSKARRTVQVTVLLAVVVWLLYQTKNSYDKKTEVAENNYNMLATGVVDINFGRKVNAGSQNENSVDVHREKSDETTEAKENGVDIDAWNREETIEVENESEESQQGIANGNVDDNGEVNTEGGHESFSEIKNDSDSSSEQNEFPKEGATEHGDGESTTSNEASVTEDGWNVSRGSEHGETGGENSDKAEPVTEESTDTSVSNDQGNAFVSEDKDAIHEGETMEAQEHTQSDTDNASSNTQEDAATNSRSDANENVNLPNSTDENNVASEDSQKEGGSDMGNNSMDATRVEGSLEDGDSNSVMRDGNGSPGSEEGESQVDVNSESESRATGNNSVEAEIAEKNSEVENGNLSNSSEENSSDVLSDNNGAPKDEEIQSQKDLSSEVATDDTVIKDNDSKPGKVAVEEVQSQENNESQNNEQNDSEMQNNEEAPKEEVASNGDDATKAETTGNVEDTVTEPASKEIELSYVKRTDPIPSDLGSDIENAQEGNTGSEASLSGSGKDLKKSVEL